jgi:hypothetical protein
LSTFVVKDSGERQEFSNGMVRDVEDNKIDYTLVLDGPMFDRWAEHLTKGARKYSARNWMLASGQTELERFKRSALRHFLQWFRDDVDEDHGAAVMFNINGAEYVKGKLGAGGVLATSDYVLNGPDNFYGNLVRVEPSEELSVSGGADANRGGSYF